MISNHLNDNKKIVIVCQSQKFAVNITNLLNEEFQDKLIKCYVGNGSDIELMKLKNVNDEWLPLDVLIYSPTIEGGVNFNLPHFDKKYGQICTDSSSPRGFNQSLKRIRQFTDNKVLILNTPIKL